MTPEELLTTTRSVRRRPDLTPLVPLDLVEQALTTAYLDSRGAAGNLFADDPERSAVRTLGLAAAWTTPHPRHEMEVADILGLPDGVHQAALVPAAYYTGDPFRPAPRQPLDEVLHVDRW